MSRNLNYFNNNRIVYKRDPITDKPTHETKQYMFFEQGTYECYYLFTSKAKITTFKSLKWHLLVLWYLNPDMDKTQFSELASVITYKPNGFTTFEALTESGCRDEKSVKKFLDSSNSNGSCGQTT